MKTLAVTRLALVLGATVAFAAACSTNDPASSISAPRTPNAPSFALGTATAGQTQVCLAAGTPAGSYTMTTVETSPVLAGDAVVSPVVLTPGGTTCAIVFTRSIVQAGNVSPVGSVSITASGPAGTFTYTLVCDNPGLCSNTSGGNPATGYANAFHGSLVTFSFTPSTPPPSKGCVYSHGWYKNQGNSTVPNTPFFGPGGTGPVTWRTQVGLKATAYDKLAYQYIAAKLSVGAGTPPAEVAAALASAEAFFTNRQQGTGTPPAGVADTLDKFVNGGYAGWPHC